MRHKSLTLKPQTNVSDKYLTEHGERIKAVSIEKAREGYTFARMAKELGISNTTLLSIRSQDSKFAVMLEKAMADGSTIVLEELRSIPYTDASPALMKVQIQALCSYLELRWPERYGKRMEVTVKTIDMRGALEKARKRAGLTIESSAESVAYSDMATDNPSFAAGNAAMLAAILE